MARADRRSATHDLRQPLAAAEMYTHLLAARLGALGVDVHVPTPAESTQWQIACRRVYARWKVATNAALVGKIEQVVEQSRKS